MKRFLIYFIFSITMIFVLTAGFEYQEHVKELSQNNFDYMPSVIYSFLFPIVIGVLFGIPILVKRIRSAGVGGYDWAKFVAVCLPALYIAILPLLYVNGITLPYIQTLISAPSLFTLLPSISEIVFGFVLVECVQGRKHDRSN